MFLLYHGQKFMQVYGKIKTDMKKIFELVKRYQDIILYLFFGGLTTVVNVVSYAFFAKVLGFGTFFSTVIAWFLSVLVAYLTNRKWVFHSEAKGFKEVAREVVSFFSCRIATGVVDWVIMLAFVDGLHLNDIVIKIVANVVVIILNYVASKLVIFAKKDKKEAKK